MVVRAVVVEMVVMVVFVAVIVNTMMAFREGSGRDGEHHQQQDCGKKSLHDKNVARGRGEWKRNSSGAQMAGEGPLQLVDSLAGYGGDGVELQLAALCVVG